MSVSMRARMQRLAQRVMVVACLAGSAACSDDTTNNGMEENNATSNNAKSGMCAAGERYNPILERCVAIPTTPADMNTPDQGVMPDMPAVPVDMREEQPDQDVTPDQDVVADMGPGMDMTPGVDMTPGMDMMPGDMSMMPEDMNACGVGKIVGVACVPSGEALPNAQVTVTGVDCRTGMPFTKMTTASSTGRYELSDIPSGDVEVTLKAGSFERTFRVTLRDGQELDLTQQASKVCIEGNSVSIAVISGEYDDVEGILDELQLQYEIKGNDGKSFSPGSIFGPGTAEDSAGLSNTRSFLLNPTEMARYDVIFINCGNLWDALNGIYPNDVNTIATNLYNYYQSGKSIYASDWAHMFIERPFASVIDFFPSGGNDSTANEARQGFAPQVIQANVESAALQSVLGRNTVAIDFPHNPPQVYNDHWVMMASANPSATVHLRGDAKQCGGGGLCSTAGATLPGAPLLVTYKNSVHGGALAFTSFHNHPAGVAVSPDISKILKFLIFQL